MKLINLFLIAMAMIVASGCCVKGPRGEMGPVGAPGQVGLPGQDGVGCSVVKIEANETLFYGGAIVTCGATQVLLSNGEPGEDGAPAPQSPFAITSLINLCNNGKEYILRMATGELLAHYSQGQKQYLTVIGAGSYQSTDGFSCNFTVTPGGNVTW